MSQPLSSPVEITSPVGEWMQVEPRHCHQRLVENTLVEAVQNRSVDGRQTAARFRFVPEELPFFFDHAIDHLPGMLEINALRQMSLALAHVVYRVPMTWVAILGWLKVEFFSYGELAVPTVADVDLVDSRLSNFKKDYVLSGLMRQGDTHLMRMDGQLIMMHPRLAQRVRRKEEVKETHVVESRTTAVRS